MIIMNSGFFVSIIGLAVAIVKLGRTMWTLAVTHCPLLVGSLKSLWRVIITQLKQAALSLIDDLKMLGRGMLNLARGAIASLITGIKMAAASMLSLAKGAIVALIGAVKTMAAVMVGAIRAISAAIMANPIGLIITAIVAVVALLAYVIYKYWEPIKAFLLNLWASIKTGAVAAWEGIKNFFVTLWENIKSIFSSAWDFIKKILSFSPLGLIISNWSGIVDAFAGIWESVTSGVVNTFTGIKDFIIKIVDWIWTHSGLDKILSAVGKIKGWFSDDEEETEVAEASTAHKRGQSLIAPQGGAAQAEVVVRFDNMPRGAQASPASYSGGMDLGLETSYALPTRMR
jgi:phage-related protein